MGKKDKNRLAELLELATQSKTLKAKKKAIQFECCHKDRKGNFALKATDKDYVFKCKICKDKKVDLSIMDPAKGSIEDQLKAAFKTIWYNQSGLSQRRKGEMYVKIYATKCYHFEEKGCNFVTFLL